MGLCSASNYNYPNELGITRRRAAYLLISRRGDALHTDTRRWCVQGPDGCPQILRPEGRPRFTAGTETLDAQPGQIIVVPPETPHKFVNIGEGPLRQIDIHASPRFVTEWLED